MLEGIERGVIRKRWRSRIPIAIVFPDSYALGSSNLGFQTLYRLLNRKEAIAAERFFLPSPKGPYKRLRSVESNRPLSDFPVILFSISFELSYLNIPPILKGGGVPGDQEGRIHEGGPLVLAGGVACQINPEPIAPVMDAFILGDLEAISEKLSDFFIRTAEAFGLDAFRVGGGDRMELLGGLASDVEGVYLPHISHEASEGRAGSPPFSIKVPRVMAPPCPAPYSQVLSSRAAFPDTFLMEVGRGCGRGCRFCAAGFVYRPPRPWPKASLDEAISKMPGGIGKVGLVGLEFIGSRELEGLTQELLSRGLSIGFSSLRADALTPDFVSLLKASGSETATIAPEAGSQRLRDIINKHLAQEQIIEAACMLALGGIPNLKLYFMMGLPFEEDGDIEQLASLVGKISEATRPIGRGRGRLGQITVSVGTFVPKAWTPFMFAPFCEPGVLKRRRRMLRRLLSPLPNIRLQLDSLPQAMAQAVLSRGDRRLYPGFVTSRLRGAGVRQALKELGMDAEKYLRGRGETEPFAWEVLDHGIKREFFLAEWRKAHKGRQSRSCDTAVCRKCGACS